MGHPSAVRVAQDLGNLPHQLEAPIEGEAVAVRLEPSVEPLGLAVVGELQRGASLRVLEEVLRRNDSRVLEAGGQFVFAPGRPGDLLPALGRGAARDVVEPDALANAREVRVLGDHITPRRTLICGLGAIDGVMANHANPGRSSEPSALEQRLHRLGPLHVKRPRPVRRGLVKELREERQALHVEPVEAVGLLLRKTVELDLRITPMQDGDRFNEWDPELPVAPGPRHLVLEHALEPLRLVVRRVNRVLQLAAIVTPVALIAGDAAVQPLQLDHREPGPGEQQEVDLGHPSVHADEGQVRPRPYEAGVGQDRLDRIEGLGLGRGRRFADVLPVR